MREQGSCHRNHEEGEREREWEMELYICILNLISHEFILYQTLSQINQSKRYGSPSLIPKLESCAANSVWQKQLHSFIVWAVTKVVIVGVAQPIHLGWAALALLAPWLEEMSLAMTGVKQKIKETPSLIPTWGGHFACNSCSHSLTCLSFPWETKGFFFLFPQLRQLFNQCCIAFKSHCPSQCTVRLWGAEGWSQACTQLCLSPTYRNQQTGLPLLNSLKLNKQTKQKTKSLTIVDLILIEAQSPLEVRVRRHKWSKRGSGPPVPSTSDLCYTQGFCVDFIGRINSSAENKNLRALPSQTQRHRDSCCLYVPTAGLPPASPILLFFWVFFLLGSCFSRMHLVQNVIVSFCCI